MPLLAGPRVAAAASAEQRGHAAPAHAAERLRVLFVGNSLTAYNAMPSMIGELAAAAGEPRPLEPVLETAGGYELAKHLQKGRVQQRLQKQHFDVVVLQEQGQLPGWIQRREAQFAAPARALAKLVEQAGARLVLFSTFARREGDFSTFAGDTYEAMQARVDDGYATLGRELHAPVVPVGRIWRATLRARPTLPLWVGDGLHPSRAGSYLVACAFYVQLYGHSPLGIDYTAGLPPALARAIQESVDAQLQKSASGR